MNAKDARVLIFGSKGQLGSDLKRSFSGAGSILAYSREDMDVTDASAVHKCISEFRPNIILNATAYTAVDRAESERELAMAINGEAPGVLAEEARRQNSLFIHYSTDYVFDGTKTSPYVEEDEPNPLNIYGKTKLAGERAVQKVGGRYLIFRTSWVYGPHGNNFMLTMLRLGRQKRNLRVVDDQVGAPTTSRALAHATYSVVTQLARDQWNTPDIWAGLYHMTCGGKTTWCGFARAILAKAMGCKDTTVLAIRTEQYPTPARRPANSVLSNCKLTAKFRVSLPGWSDALDDALRVVGGYNSSSGGPAGSSDSNYRGHRTR